MRTTLRMVAAMLAVLMLLTGLPGEVIALAADGIEKQRQEIGNKGTVEDSQHIGNVDGQANSYMPKEVGELLGRQDTGNFTEEEWALIYPYLIDDTSPEVQEAKARAEQLSRQSVYYRVKSPSYTASEVDINEITFLKKSFMNLNDEDFDILGRYLELDPQATQVSMQSLVQEGYSLFQAVILLKDSLAGFLTLDELKTAYAVYAHRPDRDAEIAMLKELIEKIEKAQIKARKFTTAENILVEVQPAEISAEAIKGLFLEGYRTKEICAAYMVSSVIQKDMRSVITAENSKQAGKNATAVLPGVSDSAAELLDEMAEMLPVNMSAVAEYLMEEGVTPKEYQQQIAQMAALMSGTSPEPKEEGGMVDKNVTAPFKLQNGNGATVDLNSGALGYGYDLFSLEGRNGLNADLSLRYNSGESAYYKEGIRTEYNPYTVYYQLSCRHRVGEDYFYDEYGQIVYLGNGSAEHRGTIEFQSLNALQQYIEEYYGKVEYRGVYQRTRSMEINDYLGHTNVLQGNGQINPWVVFSETSNPAPSSIYYGSGDYSGALFLSRTANSSESTGYVYNHPANTWWYRNVWYAYYSGTIYSYKSFQVYRDHLIDEITIIGDTFYNEMPYDKLMTSYLHTRYDLGAGWSFNLPSIEIDGSHKSLHLGNGSVYAINSNLSLKEYTLQDMKLESNTTFYNGQAYSAYALKYKDGTAHFFASDGRVIGKRDRFGNAVKYQHIQRSGYYYLSKIIDSVGREITITYSDIAGGCEISITTPDGAVSRLTKLDNKLTKISDPLNAETVFSYTDRTANYSLLSKTGGLSNSYAILDSITFPTGAKSMYTYETTTRNLGGSGYTQAFRIKNYKDYSGATVYNECSYTYTGDYTGYPTYSNPESLPDTYSYSVTVADSAGLSTTYLFNNKHLNTKINLKNGASLLQEAVTVYDSRKQPESRTIRRYNGAGVSNESIELYEYDVFGDLLNYWSPLASGVRANTQHKTIYIYDSIYHYLINKSYYRDADHVITEQNIPSPDSKTISSIIVKENGSLKEQSSYTYDTYGNARWVIQISGTDSITKEYVYGAISSLLPYTGLYLTKSVTYGVRDADGNLAAAKPGNPTGLVDECYSYDVMGNIISITDRNGGVETFKYDANNRLIKITHEADGTYQTYQYDDVLNTTTTVNEAGVATKYVYDKLGHHMSVVDVESGQPLLSYTYDSKGRMLSESTINSGAYGSRTMYAYDLFDRVLSKTVYDKQNVKLAQENYVYDDAAESGAYAKTTKTVLGDTHAPSVVTTSYTDKMGYVAKQGLLYQDTERLDSFTYDYLGRKVQSLSAADAAKGLPYSAKWELDYAGRVIKEYNTLGDFSTVQYDGFGRKISVTDIKGNKAAIPYSTTFTYDVLGRLLTETHPFNETAYSQKKYYYDLAGNITLEKTTNNLPGEAVSYRQTGYGYNERGMLTMVTTYDNSQPENYTQYIYDALGNKLRMYTGLSAPLTITGLDNVSGQDTEFSVTKYTYDRFSNLLSLTDPLGQTETSTYDLNGNLLTKLDRNGNTTVYTYDALGRLTRSEVSTVDESGDAYTEIGYSLTGAKIYEENAEGSTSYQYDERGLATGETSGDTAKSYAYDLAGNRVGMTIALSGTQTVNTVYAYDNLNRLVSVEEGGVTASYGYDENGNRAFVKYDNGVREEYSYNRANLLLILTNKDSAGEVASQYTYTYALDGNQVKKVELNGKTTAYTYDGLGRLVSERETLSGNMVQLQSYTYDDSNNRATMTTAGEKTFVTVYAYDANNRLLTEIRTAGNAEETTSYFYDRNGNQVGKSTELLEDADGASEKLSLSEGIADAELYVYNGFNQMKAAYVDGQEIEYAYNVSGLRISKTVDGVSTGFIWDGQQVVLELAGNNAVTARYIRGINLIAADFAEQGISYYLYNAHGDVVQLTDASGAVTRSYDYDAFGVERNPDSADTNPFRYCGEYFDKETGTIYLRARYYDPVIGRFTQMDTHWNPQNMIYGDNPVKINDRQPDAMDPLGLRLYTYVPDKVAIMQSGNLYVYALNNPFMYIDPNGEFVISTTFLAVLLLTAGIATIATVMLSDPNFHRAAKEAGKQLGSSAYNAKKAIQKAIGGGSSPSNPDPDKKPQWKTVQESNNASKQVDKLDQQLKKVYEQAISNLAKGDFRGLNVHRLSTGQMAADLAGIGGGRGSGRILYEVVGGVIKIIEVTIKHYKK